MFPMLKREQAKWGPEVEHAGRWAKGIWVGRSWNSNESIVLHANDISRPITIKRLVDKKKWRGDLIESATVMPWGEELAREDEAEGGYQVQDDDAVRLESQQGDQLLEQRVQEQYPEV